MSDSVFADMIKEIYEAVLPEMAENEIPDTTENRIAMLQGLRDAWNENDSETPEAWPWIAAVNVELIHLQIQQFTDILK